MKIATIIVMILSIATAHADVTFLPKGSPAPNDGYLFDKDTELKARTAVQDVDLANKKVDLYKQMNDSQSQSIDLLNQRVGVYQKQSDELSKQVIEARDKDFWHSFIFFATGAASAILMAYGISKATK